MIFVIFDSKQIRKIFWRVIFLEIFLGANFQFILENKLFLSTFEIYLKAGGWQYFWGADNNVKGV